MVDLNIYVVGIHISHYAEYKYTYKWFVVPPRNQTFDGYVPRSTGGMIEHSFSIILIRSGVIVIQSNLNIYVYVVSTHISHYAEYKSTYKWFVVTLTPRYNALYRYLPGPGWE